MRKRPFRVFEDANRILVTGASGFIGGRLCDVLVEAGYSVIEVGRTVGLQVMRAQVCNIVVDLVHDNIPQSLLQRTQVIVHCAGRAHLPDVDISKSSDLHRVANLAVTDRLARQAAGAGVKRFIYISSIGVNGNETLLGQKFAADDAPAPYDAYTSSKYEAEQSLKNIATDTGLEVVIIRPPLVYGCGAPGNFRSLIAALKMGLPLPLGAINNSRSFVALDNLVDLIVTCLDHSMAANQVFLVSDDEDVSTTTLLRKTAEAMEQNLWLVPVPVRILELCAAMLGKQETMKRLCGSLQIDIQKTRRLLGWNPPLTLNEGLKKAVEGIKR